MDEGEIKSASSGGFVSQQVQTSGDRQPYVHEEVTHLEVQVSRLEIEVNGLYERLAPVMRSPEPMSEKLLVEPDRPAVPLADRIRDQCSKLAVLTSALNDIYARLEV